jgi:molybdopterin converting factor small subunit
MSIPIRLSIKMFGAFRKYHQGTLDIEVLAGCTMQAVKGAIAEALRQSNPSFSDVALVHQSAIADHQRVYREDECISMPASLAILPPVCGG